MKLIQTLKLLPPSEYSAFAAFLENPLFNKRSDLTKLFAYIEREGFPRLDPKAGYAAAFGSSSQFELSKWHLTCSRLLKVLEEYFAHRAVKKHTLDKKIYVAEFYREEKQVKFFEKTLAEADKALATMADRSEQYWQRRYQLQDTRFDYIESQNRSEKTNLQQVSEALDTFFIISKLKQGCRQISRDIINAEKYNIALLDEVIVEIENNDNYLKIPAVAVYYLCYKAIGPNGTQKDFQNLRSAIQTHADFFSNAELRDIYTIAINYCIKQLNTGKDFNRETFELYRLTLDLGLLKGKGAFPESTFINIVTLANRAKEFDWAYSFIEEYQDKLKLSFRNSVPAFARGNILYAQGAYDECLTTLAQVSTKATFVYLGARTIQLKIFYEQEAWDALDSLLSSLRVYIQRRNDLGYRKKNYTNLIRFTNRLLQLHGLSDLEKEKFRTEVATEEIFTERSWFLEKIGPSKGVVF